LISNSTIFPPQHQTTDKGHGRLEERQIWISNALNGYLDFPYVRQVFVIRRQTLQLKTGKLTEEIVYGITSLPPEKADPQRLLELNRGHWSIENQLHYVRDETFGEDRSQIRRGNGPQVLATFKNLAISLLRWCKYTNIAYALRQMAAKPFLSLKLIGL
jgi:hypothetical protein